MSEEGGSQGADSEFRGKEIVNEVQKKGDTLDRVKRLTGRIRRGPLAVTSAITAPLGVELMNSDPSLHYLLSISPTLHYRDSL